MVRSNVRGKNRSMRRHDVARRGIASGMAIAPRWPMHFLSLRESLLENSALPDSCWSAAFEKCPGRSR